MQAKRDIKVIIEKLGGTTMGSVREDITPLFHEDVIFMAPDFNSRIQGRQPCLNTYAVFRDHTDVHEYRQGEPEIDLFGLTAVASYPFDVRYTLAGQMSRESGRDILVFTNNSGHWAIAWRTIVIFSAEVIEPDAGTSGVGRTTQ